MKDVILELEVYLPLGWNVSLIELFKVILY